MESFRQCCGQGNFHHVSFGGKWPVTSSSRWGKTAQRLGMEGNRQNYGRSCTLGWDLVFDLSATCVNCKGSMVFVLAFLFSYLFILLLFKTEKFDSSFLYFSCAKVIYSRWYSMETHLSGALKKIRYFYAVLGHVILQLFSVYYFKAKGTILYCTYIKDVTNQTYHCVVHWRNYFSA